jgi:hypothetical protein
MTAHSPPRASRSPLLRFFSSIRLGIFLMTLILIYAAVLSALPQVRGMMELSEMAAFQHWLFATLVGLFCLTLAVATWTRIRWNLTNAGVLTVHAGLLIMTGGSVLYFAGKIEGDALLRSPRIEFVNQSGTSTRVVDELLAEAGQAWAQTMPAFGGRVAVRVSDVRRSASSPVSEAVLDVRVGQETPRTITLTANQPAVPIAGTLGARLTSYPAEKQFYDGEAAALYVRPADEPQTASIVAELHGLPLFRERYLDDGRPLRDRNGRAVESKRTWPHLKLLGLTIPTGWLEPWRLPIRVQRDDLPFDVEVTGFVPYIAGTQTTYVPGSGRENPAIRLGIVAGAESMNQWLVANDPAASLLDASVPIEFRWVAGAAERDELLRPLPGPHELTIEVRDPPVSLTVPIAEGQTIAVPGTSYQLTVKQLADRWPLMTPGFERATSPMASIDVQSAEKRFNRTVIQRFPQLSQDIDEQGLRRREGPYDPNITLLYRTCENGWIYLIAGPQLEPEIAVFDRSGRPHRAPLPVGGSHGLEVFESPVKFTLLELIRDAAQFSEPVIEPLATRRPSISPARLLSAIRMRFSGRGALAGWSQTRWCLFSQYPHIDARPLKVSLPDGQSWEVIYSRMGRDLGASLIPGKLSVVFFPGRQNVESWRSDFFVQDDPASTPQPAAVYTNQTAVAGGWTLFQSGASQDHWSYTILGVGNRRGIWTMLIGCIMITLGSMYAFYVKPALIRHRKRRALAEAESRGRLHPDDRPARPAPQPVHAGQSP